MQQETKEMDFYKEHYCKFEEAKIKICGLIYNECSQNIEHVKVRIKSQESAKAKLEKLGFDKTLENAINNLRDIVGVRIVCRFLADVYTVANAIKNNTGVKHIISKDYIKYPKENGYRSYHVILEIEIDGRFLPVEVQIRTISQDSWASLEHKMKYKKEISNAKMIKSELKRLSDEMASADVCMQTLKELINNSEN